MSHFAPDVDIAWVQIAEHGDAETFAEDHSWGLIVRDRGTETVVGFELWKASERLPAELLAALPSLEAVAADERLDAPSQQPA